MRTDFSVRQNFYLGVTVQRAIDSRTAWLCGVESYYSVDWVS